MGKRILLIEKKDSLSNRERLLKILNDYYGLSYLLEDFKEGEKHKPFLPFPISFNISDSEELRAYYINDECISLGLDLQFVKSGYSIDKLICRVSHDEEVSAFSHLENPFFALWAVKEALIKEKGGSVFDMNRSEISSFLDKTGLFFMRKNEKSAYLALYPMLSDLTVINETDFSLERTELAVKSIC